MYIYVSYLTYPQWKNTQIMMYTIDLHVYRATLGDENPNEEFLDITESYYNAKQAIDQAQSNMRTELLSPQTKDKSVRCTFMWYTCMRILHMYM